MRCFLLPVPSSKDIIMGRSALCQGHVGNVKYINQIHKQFQRYDAATQRYQKTAISAEIVEAMQASGARFLKERNDGSFILLSDDEAREKVSTVSSSPATMYKYLCCLHEIKCKVSDL